MSRRSTEPVASVNGRLVPLREACVSVIDDGIVQGATVTERLRTFGHRPYLVAEHLQRLRRSLELTGVAPVAIVDDLPATISDLVSHNARQLEDWQDLSVVVFITPGPNRGLTRGAGDPTICVHSNVVPVPEWGEQALAGVRLVTPSIGQVSSRSLDPQIKHRSRLHWFVADQQVRRLDPQAFALLLDERDHVTETSSGNLMSYDGSRLITPRPSGVLDGISRQVITRLASAAGIETVSDDMTAADVLGSREAFLTSTGYCLLSVTRLNGQPIGDGKPGPLARRLLQDWSAEVGVDILAQHLRAAESEDS